MTDNQIEADSSLPAAPARHESISKFNAVGPMLGYIYQVRVALLWAARRSKLGKFLASIETLDDVSFSNDTDAAIVLQTKHSIDVKATMSDLSVELWKTLRIWMVGLASGEVSQNAARFLITTAEVSPGTACEFLADGPGRNIEAAANALERAASISENESIKAACSAFLAMTAEQRNQLVGTIYVVGSAPNAVGVDDAIREELHFVSIHHSEKVLQMLEGWWFKRVVFELSENGSGISSSEFEDQISEIQESLKRNSLPIAGEIDELAVVLSELPEYADRTFYKQVAMVGAKPRRIQYVITSYLQAFQQRSQWTRDDLLFNSDLRKYDRLLADEWGLRREQVCGELAANSSELELAKAGREILEWAEKESFLIRPGVTVPWLSRGSFHMLADDLKVGWHPEFEDRFAAASEVAATNAGEP